MFLAAAFKTSARWEDHTHVLDLHTIIVSQSLKCEHDNGLGLGGTVIGEGEGSEATTEALAEVTHATGTLSRLIHLAPK